jgi:F0F1-type ATP synthase delta subunit
VFDPGRWALAFTECAGADVEEGAEALRIFISALETGAGVLRPGFRAAGSAPAKRLESLLRASCAGAGLSPERRGVEYAIRFICLLVKKDLLRYREALMGEVEKAADRARGVTRVRLEAAGTVTAEFEKKLTEDLRRKTGAKEIALSTRSNPALLAGYRMYIGTDVFDASLRAKLRSMEHNLAGSGEANQVHTNRDNGRTA